MMQEEREGEGGEKEGWRGRQKGMLCLCLH